MNNGVVVSVTLDGASTVCPTCGETIKLSWEGNGRLKSFPSEADQSCPHFQGAYESGTPGTVEFKFR